MSKDIVERPSHYVDGMVIEPIEFIMKNELGFAVGNVIKYICRAGKKQYDGKTLEESYLIDLAKSKRYIEMLENKAKGQDTL